MTDYRLYLLKNNQITRAEELEAEGDDEAIAQAEAIRGDQPAELWNRARVVTKFGPTATPS